VDAKAELIELAGILRHQHSAYLRSKEQFLRDVAERAEKLERLREVVAKLLRLRHRYINGPVTEVSTDDLNTCFGEVQSAIASIPATTQPKEQP